MPKLNIDLLNIFLMLLSGIFALALPFQTFLIVYAFLGPLHYLTEINWLQQHNYFLQNKKNVYYLFLPILIIGGVVYIPSLIELKPIIPFLIFFTLLVAIFNNFEEERIYKNWKFLFLTIIGSITSFYFRNYFHSVFSIFFPTLIHVFVFTGIFMLSGFLKTKNKLSLVSFIFFILIAGFLLSFNWTNLIIEKNIVSKYQSFEKLNQILLSVIGEDKSNIYVSNFGIRIMQFIAFAYSYHYFNWFSKTSIIQWHKTTKTKILGIVLIWILSVFLYLYNYKTGLYWLYLLSLTHVILEFPLNITSVKNFLIKK